MADRIAVGHMGVADRIAVGHMEVADHKGAAVEVAANCLKKEVVVCSRKRHTHHTLGNIFLHPYQNCMLCN